MCSCVGLGLSPKCMDDRGSMREYWVEIRTSGDGPDVCL